MQGLIFQIYCRELSNNALSVVGVAVSFAHAMDILRARCEKYCLGFCAEKDFVFGQLKSEDTKKEHVASGFVLSMTENSDDRTVVKVLYRTPSKYYGGPTDVERCEFGILSVDASVNRHIEKRDEKGTLDTKFRLEVDPEAADTLYHAISKEVRRRSPTFSSRIRSETMLISSEPIEIAAVYQKNSLQQRPSSLPSDLKEDLEQTLRRKFKEAYPDSD